MMNLIPLKIFISSPSDVNAERSAAERVIERLGREFGGFFAIQAELWEQEPLRATAHFQDQIPRPSEADIVLVIVWSRLGTRLPADRFKGMLSGGAVTGTEWEFEESARSFRERGKPDLLFYRKTARIDVALDDDTALQKRLADKSQLDDFLKKWFFTGAAEFKYAFSSFATTIEFELTVEHHLRKLIRERLNALEGIEAAEPARWQGGSPFRGLEPFNTEHAAIFYGRSRARTELREALAARARQGTTFVLLLGMSGAGKSSLVRAALIPDLRVPGMVEGVGLFRDAIMQPSSEAGDPFLGLANALLAASALPELATNGVARDALVEQLRERPASLGATLDAALQTAGHAAGLVPDAKARLLLVIDQIEEIFTTPTISAQTRSRLVDSLAALAKSGVVWVVATMRSDMFHHLAKTPRLAELAEGAGQYHLLPPQPEEIAQIIREPAAAAGLRFEVDPDNQIGLDEVLRSATENDPAALPLLEFTLDELFKTRTGRGLLTYQAYHQLGGIEGALARRAEDVHAALPEAVRAALPSVAAALVAPQRGSDGGFAARRAPFSLFQDHPERRALVEAFIAARLFVSDAGARAGAEEGRTIRVAHEALFRQWPRMHDMLERDAAFVAARERLSESKERWLAEGRASDLLLAEGRALAEGEELLKSRPEDLDAELRDFIRSSATAVNRRRNRNLRIARSVAAGFAVIALIAGVAGWIAHRNRIAADQARAQALRQRDAALSTESYFLASLSEKSTRAHDAFDGVLLARAALPGDPAHPDRPIVSEARDALAYALENLDGQRGLVRMSGARVAAGFAGAQAIASFSPKDRLRLSRLPDGQTIRRIGSVPPVQAWFTADGKTVILRIRHGNADQLRFYDLATGRRLHTLPLPGSGDNVLLGVAVNRSGTLAALVYSSGKDSVISLPDGHPVYTHHFGGDLQAHIMLARFVDASQALVMSSMAGKVYYVPFRRDKAPIPLAGESAVAWALASDRSGRLAATGGIDGSVHVWSLPDDKLVGQWRACKGPVQHLILSADGTRLALVGADRSARVFAVPSGKQLVKLDHVAAQAALALSPDDKTLAVADPDFTIRIVDVANGVETARLTGHDATISGLSFDPNGPWLLSTAADGTARVWDYRDTSNHILTTPLDAGGALAANRRWLSVLGYTGDGMPYAGGVFGSVSIWRHGAGGSPQTFALNKDQLGIDLNDLASSPGGRFMAYAFLHGKHGFGGIWSVDRGRAIAPLPDLGFMATGLSVSHHGNRLLATGVNDSAALLDLRSGKLIGRFLPAGPPLRFVRGGMSADGRLIWLGAGKRLWLRNGETLAGQRMIRTGGDVWQAAIGPKDRHLLEVSMNGAVNLWSTADGEKLAQLRPPESAPAVFARSANGARALLVDKSGLLTVFDLGQGSTVSRLRLPGGVARSAVLSNQGRLVAVQGGDNGLRIWRVAGNAPLLSLPGDWLGSNGSFSPPMAFSPDGRHLLMRWKNSDLRVWTIDRSLSALVARADRLVPRAMTPSERQQLIMTY